MTEDAVAAARWLAMNRLLGAFGVVETLQSFRATNPGMMALINGDFAALEYAAEQRGRSKAGPCPHCISPGNCGSDPQAGKQCAHGWDESLIETTDTGVVCRRCGAEGAVYR